jgi:hypothetical protein
MPVVSMSGHSPVYYYRKLLQAGLHAVQYSKPARYALVRQLRNAFRQKGAKFDENRVRRTVWFLNAAANEKGLEHKIVKNLLRVAWHRSQMDPFKYSLQQSKPQVSPFPKDWI